jgi:bifunctional oligoribonuclease and PAP phosphatase NrnA
MADTIPKINNHGEADYTGKISQIAEKLRKWDGPIVLISHVDPDGDALASTLALKLALDSLGKATQLAMEPPRYLKFLVEDSDIVPSLESLAPDTLLVVMDVEVGPRATGAPLEQAAFIINIDHHGSNPRKGDLSCVEPSKAATAQMTKDLITALAVPWTVPMATVCLSGILTDTGNFRYGNTTPEVLQDAGELIAKGVDYAELTDRLQFRHPDYFRMLGMVMSTISFHADGLLVMAHMTKAMIDTLGPTDDDSNDYVGLIRYAEGSKVAVFLREQDDVIKISVRTRDGVSAQRICTALGGGGHVNAAGAKLAMSLTVAQQAVIREVEKELELIAP